MNTNTMQFWWGFRYAWLGILTLGRGKQKEGDTLSGWFFAGYTLAVYGTIFPLVGAVVVCIALAMGAR
jgi:CHASE2 domain-containing sensor protein